MARSSGTGDGVSSANASGRRSGVGMLHRSQQMKSPLMGLTELADLLGVHRSTLYRSIDGGRFPLPIVRVGARISVPRAAVDRLIVGGVDSPEPLAPTGLDGQCPTCGTRLFVSQGTPCSISRRSSSQRERRSPPWPRS